VYPAVTFRAAREAHHQVIEKPVEVIFPDAAAHPAHRYPR
jgi:hypothetical protein